MKILSQGGGVKSVQRGVLDTGFGGVLKVPISPVNVDRSVVRVKWTGIRNSNAELLSGNEITFTRGGSTGQKCTWEVTEYHSLKSKQTGELTTNSRKVDVIDIAPVDPAKSELILSQDIEASGNYDRVYEKAGYISAAGTQIIIDYRSSDYTSNRITWQVIEHV